MRLLPSLCLSFLCAAAGAAAGGSPFDEQRAAFTVQAHREEIPYGLFALYVLPGESLEVSVVEPGWRRDARLTATWPGLRFSSNGVWRGRAPSAPGIHGLQIESRGESVRLNVLVLVPASEVRGGALRGYRIGSYPERPLRALSSYKPPRGFVEVTPENLDTELSPHFTLGQFVCKQEGEFPKFVVLRERMLLKLEYLLALVNARGLRADTFFVMSGYRTPSYNTAIGNVGYSRHQYGDAADIFIDESPRDGVMDDLDGDGRIDGADADLLYDLIEEASHREADEYESLIGGLGRYGATAAHGPFVHVDARGFRARWGR